MVILNRAKRRKAGTGLVSPVRLRRVEAKHTTVIRIRPLEKSFQRLAEKWSDDTQFTSSLTAVTSHPAYNEIIKMGKPALPLILKELNSKGGYWFAALKRISGEDPTSPDSAGYYDKQREEWLAWGQKHHYL